MDQRVASLTSCSPVTFADNRFLLGKGYRLGRYRALKLYSIGRDAPVTASTLDNLPVMSFLIL